jgi:hypothetical protein
MISKSSVFTKSLIELDLGIVRVVGRKEKEEKIMNKKRRRKDNE